MVYRLLLDENVEHEVGHRLENYGHDIEHTDFIPELGKGTDDFSLAKYARETDRILLTYDDDFVLKLSPNEVDTIFYISDASLQTDTVADIVDTVSKHYPQEEIEGVEYIGAEWL